MTLESIRPWQAWAGFAATSLLLPPLPLEVGSSGPHLAIVFAFGALLTGALRFGDWDRRFGLLEKTAVALAAWFLVTSIWGGTSSAARAVLFAVAVYAVLDMRRGPSGRSAPDLDRVLPWLLGLGLASVAWGVVDFLLQLEPPVRFAEQTVTTPRGVLRRAQGVFYEAIQFGNVCAFFLLGAAAFAVRRGVGLPALAVGLVACGGLVFSFSRAAVLNAAVGLAVLLWMERRSPSLRRLVLAAAGVTAAVVAIAWVVRPVFVHIYFWRLSYTVENIFADPVTIVGARLESWSRALGVLAEGPGRFLHGVGFAALPHGDPPLIVDNQYVSLLAETGLPGVAGTLILLALILRTAGRVSRSGDPAASLVGLWSLCFWFGQIVQMFWVDLLTYWRVLPVYLGLLAWADRQASERSR